jgi:uncharacterized caspase-like protein
MAKSIYLFDPSKTEKIEENLIKAIEEGNANAFKMLAFDLPEIKTKQYTTLTTIYFKELSGKELQYCKALICAKMRINNGPEMAFVFLDKALSQGFNDSDILTNKTILNLNPKRYYELLQKYNLIASQYNFLIKMYVESRINQWQKKGKFEKTANYQQRVTEESRKQKAKEFAKYYIDSIGMEKYNFERAKNQYDADNETFLIEFADHKSIFLHVPISEAPLFDKNFKNLSYKNMEFTLYNDDFELVHLDLVNPSNNKTYVYNSKEVAAFNSELIDYQFEPVTLDASDFNRNELAEKTSKALNIDVETDIPNHQSQNPNAFALIIGNEDYQSYQSGLKKEQNVEYAIRDAHVFKEYCLKTLGIPEDNILFYTNAGTVAMNQAITQISQIIKTMNGAAEILVYYAGHGFPNEKTNEPCLIPVDVTSSSMQFAIPLDKTIATFAAYPSKKVVVFLDACFSGGGRNLGLMASRGVKIVPKSMPLSGNIVVFSASDEEQSALPYQEQKHGLFTYFLLKKLKESSGEVTLAELDAYLSKNVALKSTIVNKQEQTPKTHFSPLVKGQWENWKLK